jgi:hypothetical protein
MKLLYALLTISVLAVPAAASPVWYTASLSGMAENPPSGSPGTGSAMVGYDAATHMLQVKVTFSGLTGGTTASHIHCCTAAPMSGNAGVATEVPTFSGFPLGVMSGTYDETFDLTSATSFNPAFVTAQGSVAAAETALAAGLASGNAYLNIHTTDHPAGEIRGFLTPASSSVPEPATLALIGAGLFGIWRLRRKAA